MATNANLRYLANRLFINERDTVGLGIGIQSNLEKYGYAMRYAMNSVTYYSERYPYYDEYSPIDSVVMQHNNAAKRLLEKNNN